MMVASSTGCLPPPGGALTTSPPWHIAMPFGRRRPPHHRSAATLLSQFPLMGAATDRRDPTRDLLIESTDESACGACGRRLRRPKGVVNAPWTTPQLRWAYRARFPRPGTIHRPLGSGGTVARVADAFVGIVRVAVSSLSLACSCRLLRVVGRRVVRASHRAPLQVDAVRVVEQAVADRVGLVGVADDGVPVGHRQLAGDQRRGAFGAV